MTEQEILDKIASEGWGIVKSWEDSNVGNVFTQTVKALLLYKIVNGIAVNKTIRYAVYEDGTAAWWEKNEFPEPKPPGFQQELQEFINGFIASGIVKYARAKEVDTVNEQAIAVAILSSDNSLVVVRIYRDAPESLTWEAAPDNYPMSSSI